MAAGHQLDRLTQLKVPDDKAVMRPVQAHDLGPTTTLCTYSHLWPTAEDKTRKAATALAGEVLGAGVGNLRAKRG